MDNHIKSGFFSTEEGVCGAFPRRYYHLIVAPMNAGFIVAASVLKALVHGIA